MNKLSKLLSAIILAGAVGTGASFAAGCSHKHSFSGDWTAENGYHWHAATCKHTDEKAGYGKCEDEVDNATKAAGKDNLCDVCGSQMAGTKPETPGDVSVTGVSLSETGISVKVDEEFTLEATVSPDNATNYTVEWESDKPEIATVSDQGVVKGVAKGIATITVKAGGKTAECTVNVTDEGGTGITPTPDEKYSVTYVINGHGVQPENKTEQTALPATLPELTEEGWTFDGWFTDAGFKTEAVAGSKLTANATLYAKWTKKPTPPPVVGDKMTEEQFKAAINATLASDKFTYTANGESVKVDGDKYALAGGSYSLYGTDKKLTSYSPVGGIAWEKEVGAETYETSAAAKEAMTDNMSATLTALRDAYASVSYDGNTGKYSLNGTFVTFKDGKVSAFGTAEKEVTLSNYGDAVELPDLTPAFENIVTVKIAKNEVGAKLKANANSTFGLYADAEMTTATDYVGATANGYKHTVASASVNNKGTIISVAKLEGKIEGYFEFSASKVGSKNDMLCLRSGGSKILSLRTGDDSSNLTFRKKVGDGDTATFSNLSGLTPAASTVYKVRYTFVKGANGNYVADITINGVEFAKNEDLGVSTLDGFTLGCSNAKNDDKKGTTVVQNVRLITVDNVIICGTPAEGSFVKVENITLNKYETRIEQIGKTEKLTATISPANATEKVEDLVWSSSNTAVATVAQDGTVTAVATGEAVISVMASSGKTVQCKVTVGEAPKTKYTVTFISDGEIITNLTEQVEEGGKVAEPKGLTKEGYTLTGWAVGSLNGAIYDFDEPVDKNLELYAVWKEGEPITPPKPTNPPIQNANITYYDAGTENAAFEWKDNNAANAKVYYKLHSAGTYTEVDSALIRQTEDNTIARVDILGLKHGSSYDFKITTSGNEDLLQENVTISAYDRSGFAHFKYSGGVGAYNDDGTLKANAIVLYVTDQNKNTVELSYGGVTVKGIGNILNSVGQDTGNGETSNKGTPNTNQGIIKKLAEANIPLVVRFIGCVSNTGLYKQDTFNASSTPKIDGLTIYDSTGHGGTVGDNGHMARIKSGKDITLEGVGEDATIDGWGFHYMAESSYADGGKSFEVRNLKFINTPEDAIGMEGVQENGDLTASVERCWIHNNEFYGPHISSPAESDKKEGDGSCDFKRGQYLTVSYNYFEGCHKTNLVGSSDSSLQYNLTYHHNYWKLCKARGPLTRQANVHMYNNVFEGQTDYAMNTRANAYIFSEYNLFYMCKSPQAVESGAIKSYNDSISSYLVNKGTLGTVVTDKSQTVTNNCKFVKRNIDYSKFDTDSKLSYIPTNDYILQTDVTEARKTIAALTGVRQRVYRSAADIDLSEVSVVPDGVTPTKITTYPSEVTPGKINKKPYAFTIDRSATVTVTCSGDGVLVNEAGVCLLEGNGSINLNEPGTYMVQPVNFQPGDAGTVTAGTFKEITITSISFEEYKSDEYNAKLLADYNTKAGLINIDNISYNNASYQLIVNAKNAYEKLSPELKTQVTEPYSKVTAAFNKYIELGEAEVEGLINAIDTPVTANSGPAITRARAAYQALKKLSSTATVSNYDDLVAAEAAYEQFEVQGIVNDITALAAPSTVSEREDIQALLDEYLELQTRYQDLDEEKRGSVTNIAKVNDGIATLQEALKPYAVKDMIADLPESSKVTLADKATVTAARKAYDALDASGKTKVGDITKLTDAEAALAELASKITTVIFGSGVTLPDNVTLTGSKSNYDSSKFTYEGNEYSPLKLEDGTEVTIELAVKTTVTIHLSAGSKKIKINGKNYSSDANGDVVVTLEAGTHTITKNNPVNLLYIQFVTA